MLIVIRSWMLSGLPVHCEIITQLHSHIHNEFVFMHSVLQIMVHIQVGISCLYPSPYRHSEILLYLSKYNIPMIFMKSALTQPTGAHNDWREMYSRLIIRAASGKSLLLLPWPRYLNQVFHKWGEHVL